MPQKLRKIIQGIIFVIISCQRVSVERWVKWPECSFSSPIGSERSGSLVLSMQRGGQRPNAAKCVALGTVLLFMIVKMNLKDSLVSCIRDRLTGVECRFFS